MSDKTPPYLLVTHIPFARLHSGEVIVDELWARDLQGLVRSVGRVRVVAPETDSDNLVWGPTATNLDDGGDLTFISLSRIQSRRDCYKWIENRQIIKREVRTATLVHSHNLFPPYLPLSYAHDLAVKLGKKTIFVIAEDFYDMLDWEWIRTSSSDRERKRRKKTLERIDRRVRKSARTASLSFMHTPAAVHRLSLIHI